MTDTTFPREPVEQAYVSLLDSAAALRVLITDDEPIIGEMMWVMFAHGFIQGANWKTKEIENGKSISQPDPV